jgi:hypothetical protein
MNATNLPGLRHIGDARWLLHKHPPETAMHAAFAANPLPQSWLESS